MLFLIYFTEPLSCTIVFLVQKKGCCKWRIPFSIWAKIKIGMVYMVYIYIFKLKCFADVLQEQQGQMLFLATWITKYSCALGRRIEDKADLTHTCTLCCSWLTWLTLHFLFQQTGEYATDEEEAGTTVADGEKSIEVFDLPETEDILSPSELDATKLYQKFREVTSTSIVQFLLPMWRSHNCSPPHFSLSVWKNKFNGIKIPTHTKTPTEKKDNSVKTTKETNTMESSTTASLSRVLLSRSKIRLPSLIPNLDD